jgi:hypothetical protein
MRNYKAPWGISLIVVSSLATVLCAGIAIGFILSGIRALQWMASLPLAILVGGGMSTIRGYAVTPDAILVRRLFWTTRLPLTGLKSAQFEPDAMRGSIRTFGNGGLFSLSGSFSNKGLGAYRALVTDMHRTVVLRFPSRTVVISPAAPEEFVHDTGVASHSA